MNTVTKAKTLAQTALIFVVLVVAIGLFYALGAMAMFVAPVVIVLVIAWALALDHQKCKNSS